MRPNIHTDEFMGGIIIQSTTCGMQETIFSFKGRLVEWELTEAAQLGEVRKLKAIYSVNEQHMFIISNDVIIPAAVDLMGLPQFEIYSETVLERGVGRRREGHREEEEEEQGERRKS